MHVRTKQARGDMGHTVAAGCILDTYFKVFKSEWWFVSGEKMSELSLGLQPEKNEALCL